MRDKIARFLKKHQNSAFRKKELARLLGTKRSEYGLFRRELRKLTGEGAVVAIRGRGYIWAGSCRTVQGKLVLNQKGFGFVLLENEDDIFISSRNLKGAIHGDTVEAIRLPVSFRHGSEGQVTRIIERGKDEFLGTITIRNGMPYLEIDPVTPRRGIRVVDDSAVRFSEADAVVAKVRDWGQGRQAIQVEVVEVVGSVKDPADDMKIICHKFDLDPHFPDAVLDEASRYTHGDIPAEMQNRVDARQLTCFTIDPVDARDFDDAISLEQDDDGNAVLGVHIADVSFFVPPGSYLDREARNRGTSVYFAEGVVHMLPAKLSANLCSLMPGKDRLAISVFVTLDDSCQVQDVSFQQTVIRSKRRFTYREVQSILDGQGGSEFAGILRRMHEISILLLQRRQQMGSIDFDIPEPIFRFQNGGIPHEIHPSERLDSHRIVEEFMLLANRMVAERVPRLRGNEAPFIYRIHDRPKKADMDRFLNILGRLHLSAKTSDELTPGEFRRILSEVEDSPYKGLIENLALRTMTKAIYSTDNRGHYGLAFDTYTHFTSPIRRYPDLVVHRLLKQYLMITSERPVGLIPGDHLAAVAKQSTEAEITALRAEREYIKLKQIRWLSQHVGEKFEGIISGVVTSGFFVELRDTMVEGFVHVDSLGDDYYVYDEAAFSLVGRRLGDKYQMGDRVVVVVRKVVIEKRQATFLLKE